MVLFEDIPAEKNPTPSSPVLSSLAPENSLLPVLRVEFGFPLTTHVHQSIPGHSYSFVSPQQHLVSLRCLPPLKEPEIVELSDSFSPAAEDKAHNHDAPPLSSPRLLDQAIENEGPITSPSLSLLDRATGILSSISALLDSKLGHVFSEVKALAVRVGTLEK